MSEDLSWICPPFSVDTPLRGFWDDFAKDWVEKGFPRNSALIFAGRMIQAMNEKGYDLSPQDEDDFNYIVNEAYNKKESENAT